MLIFVASSAPWLKFLLSHLYISVAAAIGANVLYKLRTNKQFRQLLKDARDDAASDDVRTFAAAATSRVVHASHNRHYISRTLREELQLLTRVLQSPHVCLRTPIGHLIRRDPSSTAWSDSCLYAAGGFSVDMGFWWYIEWPPEVHKHTLIYRRNNKDGKLVSINVLEYAALLINYAATTLYYLSHPDPSDPSPLVLFNADNTAAESWMEKSCTSSLIGRALGRLQCAMMLNNPVFPYTGHVTTKQNAIADAISRIRKETHSMRHFAHLTQDYPALAGCKRFQPSADIISHIMAVISQKKFIDSLAVNKTLLKNPGQITSCPGATASS